MARRKADRSGYWRQIVAEQERSGLPGRRFCEQAKVGKHSFYIWRARLRREQRVEFALVEPPVLGRAFLIAFLKRYVPLARSAISGPNPIPDEKPDATPAY